MQESRKAQENGERYAFLTVQNAAAEECGPIRLCAFQNGFCVYDSSK
jgi:hypothetical protein